MKIREIIEDDERVYEIKGVNKGIILTLKRKEGNRIIQCNYFNKGCERGLSDLWCMASTNYSPINGEDYNKRNKFLESCK